ncbi:MAG TPA: DUF4956 domain-containing protein [Gemmatimonadales bacterium]|nr:DUF4956 domain-containing protein [Gemmatimonadales bacterium]
MTAKLPSGSTARETVREIGRHTVVRLVGYYVIAGSLLLLLSAMLPEHSPPGLAPAAPMPSTMSGMLDWFRGRMALFPHGAPRWVDALLQMVGAVLLVIPLAFTYVRTRTRVKFDHSLVQTVIVLPIVVTAILVVVRDSLALAFSLAGIVAAVRFRNNLRESGDAVYIFGAIGIGFASGIHALSVAAVLSIVFVVVELALWKFNFSADFERTFARLCLPSGADLSGLPELREPARAEPAAVPSADGKSTRLRIYVDRVDAARPLIEAVLARDAKRWTFEAEEPPADGGAPVLAYRVRPRKSVGLEGLRSNLLREGAPHVVAADDTPEL